MRNRQDNSNYFQTRVFSFFFLLREILDKTNIIATYLTKYKLIIILCKHRLQLLNIKEPLLWTGD